MLIIAAMALFFFIPIKHKKNVSMPSLIGSMPYLLYMAKQMILHNLSFQLSLKKKLLSRNMDDLCY